MPAIQPITTLPTFVSEEEHSSVVASTPNSFNDIQPVLKHKEENVTIGLDPPLPEYTGDGLKGTLYILTSVLVFYSSGTGRGFQIDYPSITLHAVARGESGPSIYCQLDDSTAEQNVPDEEDFSSMRELTINPSSSESIESIFEALSLCASLHPDPGAEEDDEFGDDAFVDPGSFETFNGNEDEELSEVGRAALAHLESIIYDPYEDAEDQAADASDKVAEDSKGSEK